MPESHLPPLKKHDGTTLVLSGGATKSFYFHLGVLKVMNLHEVKAIVGSSAGAVMGGFLASGVSVDTLVTSLHQNKVYIPQLEKWTKTITSNMLFRPKYVDIAQQSLMNGYSGLRFLFSLPRIYNEDVLAKGLERLMRSQSQVVGFFDSGAIEGLFKNLLPTNHFADMEKDLYVVATALDADRRAIFNGFLDYRAEDIHFMTDVPLHRAVRASAAVPGMFEPVKIKGRYYFDGEIKRTLSSDIGIRTADRVIISHTYQPLYMDGRGSIRDMGWLNIVRQSISIVLHERIKRQQRHLAENYPEKEVIWIAPDEDDLDFFLAPEFTFDAQVQRDLMKKGELAAQKAFSKQKT